MPATDHKALKGRAGSGKGIVDVFNCRSRTQNRALIAAILARFSSTGKESA